MAEWIPDLTGAAYRWQRDLGGFRKMQPDSPNAGLRNASFRGYADYMQTSEFRNALDDLLKQAEGCSTAIMCSESLWWRCHRRLIADALVALHGADVQHLMHDGTLEAHRLTSGVTVSPDGTLRYEVADS